MRNGKGMDGKAVTGIMLTLLLIGALGLVFDVRLVGASGTIYIRADGSIDPPTAPITTVDNVTYVLTDNITDSLVVQRNNIVVNGAGYTVTGSGSGSGNGITLTSRSNVTVGNMTIKNFGYGIWLTSSSNNVLSGNNVTANKYCGICLYYSSYSTLSGNNVTASYGEGIYLYYSSNSTLSGNNVTANNWYGIVLGSSSNNSIFHNRFVNNTYQVLTYGLNNVWDDGYPSGGNYWSNYTGVDLKSGVNQDQPGSDGIGDTNHTIDADNVDHYPLMHTYGSIQNLNTSLIYYTIQSAINAPETLADHVIYVKSGMYHENVLVTKSISLLGEERETTIIDGNTTVPAVQITSNNVKISGFTAQNGTWGIFIDYASNCTVSGNKVTANQYGIYLFYSSNSTVSGNNATANGYDGIYLYDSSNNTIVGNNVTANGWGIGLDYYSDTSSFFHNSFVNNGVQASVDSSCFGNVWDNGYPSGGNYWSNYTGVDLYCGSYQNETGSDGIGDTPHIIDAVNQDHYPLMKPYSGSHDVGITALAASKTVVGQGYNVSISVTVENQGDYTETFNVTIYGNTTEIETREITLSSGNSTTLTFTWNTSGFAKGNYTISAYAWPVSGETDTADNNCNDGWVKVTIPGDVTGEGTCNMLDITIMINKFMASPPDPRYNPNADLNGDGSINMVEIQIAINNFLKPDPP
jgi:parallel beta-helix repeat protein